MLLNLLWIVYATKTKKFDIIMLIQTVYSNMWSTQAVMDPNKPSCFSVCYFEKNCYLEEFIAHYESFIA